MEATRTYGGTVKGKFLETSVGRFLDTSECLADAMLLGASVGGVLDMPESITKDTLLGASVGRLLGTLEGAEFCAIHPVVCVLLYAPDIPHTRSTIPGFIFGREIYNEVH